MYPHQTTPPILIGSNQSVGSVCRSTGTVLHCWLVRKSLGRGLPMSLRITWTQS